MSKADAALDLPVLHLMPGEHVFTARTMQVNTILGSCVAATYFHGRSGTAAMFHALLPQVERSSSIGSKRNIWSFVDASILAVHERMSVMGIRQREVEVKVFGGADVFEASRKGGFSMGVAEKNVETALRVLEQCGYAIRAKDVGGRQGRKIVFLTSTGEVLLKRLHGDPHG